MEEIKRKGWSKVPILDSRPTLKLEGEKVWNAFQQLCLCRRIGSMTAEPLAMSDIHAWMQINDVTEDKADFLFVLLELDSEWLNNARKPRGNPESSD